MKRNNVTGSKYIHMRNSSFSSCLLIIEKIFSQERHLERLSKSDRKGFSSRWAPFCAHPLSFLFETRTPRSVIVSVPDDNAFYPSPLSRSSSPRFTKGGSLWESRFRGTIKAYSYLLGGHGKVDAKTEDKGNQREKRNDARLAREDAICRSIVWCDLPAVIVSYVAATKLHNYVDVVVRIRLSRRLSLVPLLLALPAFPRAQKRLLLNVRRSVPTLLNC